MEGDANRKSKFMSTPHPQTTDRVVVVFTKHNHTAERMLSHPIQSLKHSWSTVTGHSLSSRYNYNWVWFLRMLPIMSISCQNSTKQFTLLCRTILCLISV